MSYVTDSMRRELKKHVLEHISEGDEHDIFLMRVPDSMMMHVYVIFAVGRIILTGDLMLGATRNGIISNMKYGLGWFGSRKSECYLCEKFLMEEWQMEIAADQMDDLIEEHPEHAQELHELKQELDGGDIEYWSSHRMYERLSEVAPNMCDDGPPGYGYPRQDAGWLCAVQQRFVELYAESKVAQAVG